MARVESIFIPGNSSNTYQLRKAPEEPIVLTSGEELAETLTEVAETLTYILHTQQAILDVLTSVERRLPT